MKARPVVARVGALFVVLAVAVFFRFLNYENRWGLAHDQASFAIIGRYALANHSVPLLGPFSSGGPFQTGGEWYWIVMLGTLANTFSVISPWVFLSVLSVLFVLLMYIIGKRLVGHTFALIVALLAAVSPAQVTQSTNLTNQTPIGLFAALAILYVERYVTEKKLGYLWFASFWVGFAAAIHLQGIALVPLVIIAYLATRPVTLPGVMIIGLGLIVPWLPVLVVDAQNRFFTTQNMIRYYLVDQYKISYEVLGRRWLTFVMDYVPKLWAFIVGGWSPVGYVASIAYGVVTFYMFIRGKLPKIWIVLFLSIIAMMTIVRYTRTPLFESFVVFLHPFVYLATAYIVWLLYKKQKLVSGLLLTAVVLLSGYRSFTEIQQATNRTAEVSTQLVSALLYEFPSEKFAVYDYQYQTTSMSLPIVLMLETMGRLDDGGRRIGVSYPLKEVYGTYEAIASTSGGTHIYDLALATTSAQLTAWSFVNPSQIYQSTQYWYRNQTP